MDIEMVQAIVDILRRSGVREIAVRYGEASIRARSNENDRAEALPSPRAEAETQREAPDDSSVTVTADRVGIYRRSESPDVSPSVRLGQEVEQGDILGFIEAVTVLNEVCSPRKGIVTEILVADIAPVEYGEQLMIIESQAEVSSDETQ